MKKRLLFIGLLTALFSSNTLAYSNFHPIPGWYYGAIVGGQYLQDFDNVPVPQINGLTTAPTTAIYRNSIGVGFDFNFGYRLLERLRAEAEIFYGYQKVDSITSVDGTIIAPLPPAQQPTGQGNKLKGRNQNYGIMINGYFDFFMDRKNSESTFTPYVGGGIGYGRMVTLTEVDAAFQNDATPTDTIGSFNDNSQNLMVWQGIAGFGYFLDDFTFIGVDYRYQSLGKINVYGNGKGITHGIYLVLEFSVG